MNGIRVYFVKTMLCCSAAFFCLNGVSAQDNRNGNMFPDSTVTARFNEARKKKQDKAVKLSLKERMAFRANILGWVLVTPNIGMQFDLSPWDYNKWAIGADIKWNPGTNQTFNACLEYKMLDAKIEARRYFRESLTIKQGQKRMPKYWRAYYWGIYAGYTDYTMYIREGFTGKHFGVGGTAGWEIPVITFATGGLDLDFGLSAGWIYGKSKKREHNDGYEFTNIKDWHFTPYPIISEIRLALVYRFKSVKTKYNKSKR